MTFRLFPTLALLLTLPLSAGICSSDSPEADGDYTEGGLTPSEDERPAANDFVQACLDATNWSERMCACADTLSREELSPVGREFVIAGMNEDDDETERLRGLLSFEDATQAGLFMVQAGQACAAAE